MLGRPPEQLAKHGPAPVETEYLWDWYLEMRNADPLTYTEIKSWSELTSQKLMAWEVEVMRTLDRIYWKVMTSD